MTTLLPTLPTLPGSRFDCPRTCPAFEARDVCRFNLLFSALGVSRVVNSHTTRVSVEFRHADILADAVRALGGSMIGPGAHKLFDRSIIEGVAFNLPRWRFPLIATESGQLAYDDFGGSWGDKRDVDRLQVEYSLRCAESAAQSLGWVSERCAEGLRIYHPNGGHLIVGADASVEAFGFHGVGCHDATAEIARAMGREVYSVAKSEFYETNQQQAGLDNS